MKSDRMYCRYLQESDSTSYSHMLGWSIFLFTFACPLLKLVGKGIFKHWSSRRLIARIKAEFDFSSMKCPDCQSEQTVKKGIVRLGKRL